MPAEFDKVYFSEREREFLLAAQNASNEKDAAACLELAAAYRRLADAERTGSHGALDSAPERQ